MDNMVMRPLLPLVCLLLAMTFAPTLVTCQADEYTARKFCVDVLQQSKFDATQCLLKPRGFQIQKAKDRAVLTYLCCLGYFEDVTHNYTPDMSKDLIVFVAQSESASNLLNVGSFIQKCARRGPSITSLDYAYWNRMGRTVRFCKSPWRK